MANQHATAAADAGLARAGGAEALQRLAGMKAALMGFEPFYKEEYCQRFIVLENAAALEYCRNDLKDHTLVFFPIFGDK